MRTQNHLDEKKTYELIEQIPKEHQYLFQKLIDKGLIKQYPNKRIRISNDMYEIILILSRLGLL